MHGVSVRSRMDGNRGNAEFLAGALDAQCNFTPVCDQNFVEHVLSGSGPGMRTVGSAKRNRSALPGSMPSLIR